MHVAKCMICCVPLYIEPKQKTPPPSAKPEPAPLSYIRTNSIKAWNEEQERIRKEEEEAEKKKKEGASAGKKVEAFSAVMW